MARARHALTDARLRRCPPALVRGDRTRIAVGHAIAPMTGDFVPLQARGGGGLRPTPGSRTVMRARGRRRSQPDGPPTPSRDGAPFAGTAYRDATRGAARRAVWRQPAGLRSMPVVTRPSEASPVPSPVREGSASRTRYSGRCFDSS